MDLPDQPDVPDRAERARDASAARPQETLAGAAGPCRTGPFGRSGGDVPQQERLQAGPGTARRNRRGNRPDAKGRAVDPSPSGGQCLPASHRRHFPSRPPACPLSRPRHYGGLYRLRPASLPRSPQEHTARRGSGPAITASMALLTGRLRCIARLGTRNHHQGGSRCDPRACHRD